MGRRKREEVNLTVYGKRTLGSIYNLYKDNTDFATVDDFYQYAVEFGYRDWWVIDIDVKSKGLRADNISFSYATSRVRADRMKLLESNLTYGSKCLVLRDVQAQLIQLSNSIEEIEYELGRLGLDESGEVYSNIKAYLVNQKRVITTVVGLSDNLELKE